MKKIILHDATIDKTFLQTFDSTDYKIIKEDGEKIDRKYMNSIKRDIVKSDVIIKELYYTHYTNHVFFVRLTPNFYGYYDSRFRDKIKKILKTKNSIIDFNIMKKQVVAIFTIRIEVSREK